MNKKIIPIIIILLLIIIGVAVAFMISKKSTPPVSENPIVQTPTVTQNIETNNPQTTQGTLKNLLTTGKSQKCTFTNTTDKTTVTGTMYIAQGKVRGDITSKSTEFEVNTHMIVDSSFSYMWTDKTTQGFKFPIAEQITSTPSQNTNSVDLNQPLNYTCTNWGEDSSYFKLPTNITFQTLTIPTMVPTGSTGGSLDKCAVCNTLPEGEAQDTCKSQLKCK